MADLKKSIHSAVIQLFSVEKEVGKFRQILMCLAVIIFWSLNALFLPSQSPFPFNIPFFPDLSEGFLSSTVRGILLNYFSVRVLLLTITPILISWSSKILTIDIMQYMHPDLTRKRLAGYMNKCVYAINPISKSKDKVTKKKRYKLGGPLEVIVDSNYGLLLHGVDGYALFVNRTVSTQQYSLEHAEKIQAEFSLDDLNLNVSKECPSLRVDIINLLKDEPSETYGNIPEPDAQFLDNFLQGPNGVVQSYLLDNLNTFLRSRSINLKNKMPDEKAKTVTTKKTGHPKNRSFSPIVRTQRPRTGLLRRRRRSIGKFFSSKTTAKEDFLVDKLEEIKTNTNGMNAFINEKVKLFFKTEDILIVIQE